jgi:hypothetical protein
LLEQVCQLGVCLIGCHDEVNFEDAQFLNKAVDHLRADLTALDEFATCATEVSILEQVRGLFFRFLTQFLAVQLNSLLHFQTCAVKNQQRFYAVPLEQANFSDAVIYETTKGELKAVREACYLLRFSFVTLKFLGIDKSFVIWFAP